MMLLKAPEVPDTILWYADVLQGYEKYDMSIIDLFPPGISNNTI
jgi:hypothetical protein